MLTRKLCGGYSDMIVKALLKKFNNHETIVHVILPFYLIANICFNSWEQTNTKLWKGVVNEDEDEKDEVKI